MRVASLQIDSNARLECIKRDAHYFISVTAAAKATLEENSELITSSVIELAEMQMARRNFISSIRLANGRSNPDPDFQVFDCTPRRQ